MSGGGGGPQKIAGGVYAARELRGAAGPERGKLRCETSHPKTTTELFETQRELKILAKLPPLTDPLMPTQPACPSPRVFERRIRKTRLTALFCSGVTCGNVIKSQFKTTNDFIFFDEQESKQLTEQLITRPE